VGCLRLRSHTVNLSSLLLKFSSFIDCDLAVAPTGKVGEVAKSATYQNKAVTVREVCFIIYPSLTSGTYDISRWSRKG
jgi:hypothetical protein